MCVQKSDYVYTFQFCWWDHFKDLSSYPLRKLHNLACLLAELLACAAVPFAVLKVAAAFAPAD